MRGLTHAQRKRYKQEAASAVEQGWRAMSVHPAHLLELVRSYNPPTPDEKDAEIAHLKRELEAARHMRRQAVRQAERADIEGFARCRREMLPQLRDLQATVDKLSHAE